MVALAALTPLPARAQSAVPSGFIDQPVVSGFDQPVAIAQLPDGRVLVLEQKSAKLRLIVNGALAAVDPVGVIDHIRTAGAEQGALGLAVDPGWPARPYVYVHGDDSSGPRLRVSRYTLAGDLPFAGDGALSLSTATRHDLLSDVPDNAPNHNGGTLRFGPDGMLYASFGEDADPCGAQDSTLLEGAILRLDVSRLPAGPGSAPRALVAAPGNPYAASPDSNRQLMWAKGLRNPFRFAVDPVTGALFIGDVGENSWEEIDVVPAGGANLGWPLFEGFAPYTTCATSLPLPQPPVLVYDHTQGDAVIGGVVYRAPAGASSPFSAGYDGEFFFSDYYSGSLWLAFDTGAGWALAAGVDPVHWGSGFDAVSDYLVGRDGALWYCRQSVNFASGTGEVRRIVPAPGSVGPPSAAGVTLAPFPSPASGSATLRFRLPAAARVDLVVYDVRGRRVRTLLSGALRSAPGADVPWDGRDDRGQPVPAGLYLVRMETGGRALTRRLAMLR